MELVVRGLVYLGHVDATLLSKMSLVNETKRKALPLLVERMGISKIVSGQLQLLGLEKRTRVRSLQEDLATSPTLLDKGGGSCPDPGEGVSMPQCHVPSCLGHADERTAEVECGRCHGAGWVLVKLASAPAPTPYLCQRCRGVLAGGTVIDRLPSASQRAQGARLARARRARG